MKKKLFIMLNASFPNELYLMKWKLQINLTAFTVFVVLQFYLSSVPSEDYHSPLWYL